MCAASWRHYEHEADIGVEGIGTTRTDAFIQAALAMTAIITPLDNIKPEVEVEIDCQESDDELLFVDWLNALIYQMSTRKLLFFRFQLDIDCGHLHARAWGEKIDQLKHQPAVEIKGATYTTLDVHQDKHGNWHARTVVDV